MKKPIIEIGTVMYITNSCKKSNPNHCITYVSSETSKFPFVIIYKFKAIVEINPDDELMKPARGFLNFFAKSPNKIGEVGKI